MCAGRRTELICLSCSRLAPATKDEVRNLPSELAAAGATVLLSSDADATTVLLNRGQAVEQAVIRSGSIVRWVAFGRSEIDDAYLLRLTASSELGHLVVPVTEQLEPEAPITVAHMVIHSERAYRAEWAVPDLGLFGRGTRLSPDANSSLVHLVLSEFPTTSQIPVAMKATPKEIERALASTQQPRTVPLQMRWANVGHDLAVVGTGITHRVIEGPAVHEDVIPWSETTVTPTWVTESWNPVPVIRATASFEAMEAVIVSMASLLALGIRSDGQSAWFSIVPSPRAPAATMLARSAGLRDADEVGVFTDPTKIVRSSILNADDVALTVEPLIDIASRSVKSIRDVTIEALAAWQPTARVLAPQQQALADELRVMLVRRIEPAPERTRVEIGAMVEEVVKVEPSQVWQFGVALSPGQTDARRIDSKSRLVRDEGVIDREGHFGPDDVHCQYCDSRTCTLCVNGVISCDCCGVSICRTCVREPHKDLWLCPACNSVRPPTRSEAREHGRLLSTRRMLIGTDDKHIVVVEQSKGRWARRDGDEKHAIASPSVSSFLTERLSAPTDD
jgi:hypothetical protein